MTMLGKTAQAVAESISRYHIPIEKVNISNNGLLAQDSILIMRSLQ